MRRCDCEAEYCKAHKAGGCTFTASQKIQAFGYGQWLCPDCLTLAVATYPNDIVTDPSKFEL